MQRCLLTWSVGNGPGPLNTIFLKDPSSLCPQGLQVWFYKHPELRHAALHSTSCPLYPLHPLHSSLPPSIFPLPLSPQLPTTVHRHVGPTPGHSWHRKLWPLVSRTLESRPHSPHALTPHPSRLPAGHWVHLPGGLHNVLPQLLQVFSAPAGEVKVPSKAQLFLGAEASCPAGVLKSLSLLPLEGLCCVFWPETEHD